MKEAPTGGRGDASAGDPLSGQREKLLGFAYRMLGSVADAEDVIQDTYGRVRDRPAATLSPAYVMRTVANLCVDRLRAEQVRRRHYHGPWLPEPWLDPATPSEIIQLGEDMSFAFLLMLERLSPVERVVFVLREAFEYSFAEISDLLGVSAATCRKRYSRARGHLRGAELPDQERVADQKVMLERLIELVSNGSVDDLVELLSEDAVLLTDGGGVVGAAIRPVEDRARIARVLVHVVRRAYEAGPLENRFVNVNGGWGVLVLQHGAPHSCVALSLRDGRIRRLYVVRNPRKIAGLAPA